MNDEVILKLMVSMREGGHSERFMLIMECFCCAIMNLAYMCDFVLIISTTWTRKKRKKKICDDGARQAKSFIVNGMEQVVTTGLL